MTTYKLVLYDSNIFQYDTSEIFSSVRHEISKAYADTGAMDQILPDHSSSLYYHIYLNQSNNEILSDD